MRRMRPVLFDPHRIGDRECYECTHDSKCPGQPHPATLRFRRWRALPAAKARVLLVDENRGASLPRFRLLLRPVRPSVAIDRSSTRPGVRTGALTESGNGRWACYAEVLTGVISRVEPYKPEQSILVDAREQVGDLRRLAGGWHSACFGPEHRIEGESQRNSG